MFHRGELELNFATTSIIIIPSIHRSRGSTPVGVQCPLTSSLGEFQTMGLTLVSWAFARVGVHRLSLCLPYLTLLHLISFVFFLYGRRIFTHSVDHSLTHFLGEFPGLEMALVPDVVVPEAEQRCAWSRKLDSNFCPGRGRTSDLGI